jgi:DNA-3-methyladenine glycosylase I
MAPKSASAPADRCPWCGTEPAYVAYHDTEWGVPVRDSRALFGKLVLDGFQAGLSWWVILSKRARFLEVFHGFDPERMARFRERDVQRLLGDAGIIRSRAKITAAVSNARTYLENRWTRIEQIPARTPASEAMARSLRKQGFSFCGPTICYAFMQAVGMVNDHLTGCFRHAECAALAERR